MAHYNHYSILNIVSRRDSFILTITIIITVTYFHIVFVMKKKTIIPKLSDCVIYFFLLFWQNFYFLARAK